MKKIILFFILFSKVLFAQDLSVDKVIYLDSLNIETNQNNFKYYLVIKDAFHKKKFYDVVQYYPSEKIESKGHSLSNEFFLRDGKIISYFENGNIKSTLNYVDYSPDGTCSYWYEDGNKKLETEIFVINNGKEKNTKIKIINFYDPNNNQKVIDGQGEYEGSEEYDLLTDKNTIKGQIQNGFREGTWTGVHKKPDYSFTETYKNGELISGRSIDSNGIEHSYNIAFIKPEPQKGMLDFYYFIRDNFQTPRNFSGKGKVVTQFTINENGSIKNIKILRSVNKEVDEEAKRVISKYKGFKSTITRGIITETTLTMPISLESPE